MDKNTIIKQSTRATMQAVGGAIPIFGGILSAAAGVWSETEQEKINVLIKNHIKMLEEEIIEKAKTMEEVISRLDMHEKETSERIASPEYQSILKKTFRNWSKIDTEEKRVMIRNILSNSAATTVTDDDVVKMFIDWIDVFSELHIKTISAIYNTNGITRFGIWDKMGKTRTREDSAGADLFKLVIRDLSTGGIIRQHKETDYNGNFIINRTRTQAKTHINSRVATSAFDNNEPYELTGLGQQFVHYAMTEKPIKITYHTAV